MIVLPEYLPESIREMIGVIGLEDTMVIVEERPGVTLWLPSRPKTDHWLYVAIGKDQFAKLINHYGTGYLNIPRCAKSIQRLKEEQIIEAREIHGTTVEALARQYKMTDRGIRKLLARCRSQETDNQIDIFQE